MSLKFQSQLDSALESSCASSPAWDGVDFSPCFHEKLNGILSGAFISISVAAFLLLALYRIVQHFRVPASTIQLSSASKRRLSSSSPNRRNRSLSVSSVRSEVEIKAEGPNAIAEAENEVILRLVADEGKDLGEEEIRKLGGGGPRLASRPNRYAIGRAEYLSVSNQSIEDDDEFSVPLEQLNAFTRFRAIASVKKDLANVLGSAGILACLVLRFVASNELNGSAFAPLPVAAWAWLISLILVKLAISYATELRRIRSPTLLPRLPLLYTTLELHTITFYLCYNWIAFFDLRTALLNYFDKGGSFYVLKYDVLVYALSLTLVMIEILAPRPSRYSPRSTQAHFPAGDEPELPAQPEMHACLLSIVTFSFIDSYVYKTAFGKVPYSLETVPDVRPSDKTARVLLNYRREVAALEGSGKKGRFGLTFRLVWFFRSELATQQIWAYLRVSVIALPPLFLQAILAHISASRRGEYAPMHLALLWTFLLLVTQLIASLAASQSLYIGRRICINIRSIIVSEIFTKALRRKDQAGNSAAEVELDDKGVEMKKEPTEEELESANSGKILNLISVDTFRLSEVAAYLHFIYPELSLTIVITIVLLFKVLGLSALAGLVVLLLITPLQSASSRLFYVYQKRLTAAADERLNLSNEIISAIRVVKYFAWETKFSEKMGVARDKELRALWLRAMTMILSGALMFGAPVIVSVATFTFHTAYLQRELSAEVAFTSLALFNILRGPLEGITDMLINVLQAHVSLKRIDSFLQEEETAKYSVIRAPSGHDDPVVGFKDGTFTWADEKVAKDDLSIFRIKDLNLSFPLEQLSLILGPVGSGKTTLLLSLLGETNRLSGAAFLPCPVVRSSGEDPSILTETSAYCSQAPFLMSDTIKENILFGAIFNEARYNAVLDACALSPDLKMLDLGDATEVGEKGTVLSGGQKARISLARAIYSSAKYVLLDDVFSAVDAHTGEILLSCLTGKLMRFRTCILVTHAVDLCLESAAFVVTMDNGVVTSSGSPASISQPELSKDLKSVPLASVFEISEELDEEAKAIKIAEAKQKAEKLKLVKEETQTTGAVSGAVYALYIRALGGWTLLFFSLGLFAAAQGSEIAVSLALRYWAASYDNNHESVRDLFAASIHVSVSRYQSIFSHVTLFAGVSPLNADSVGAGNATTRYWLFVYVILAGFNLLFYVLRMALFSYQGIIASRVLYRDLIFRIMHAPIRFFDCVPIGRIINRLSKDMETIDQDLPSAMMFLLLEIFGTVGIIVTITAYLPSFLFAAVMIVLVYWAMGYVYLASSRELKRSESVTRSPMFSVFGEVLTGVSTIRAYGDAARFTKHVFSLLNTNNRPFFTLWQTNRWLSVRVDVAGALVSFTCAIFVLYSSNMDAALAGFLLSFAIAFNERILWVVRLWSMNEINMNSVERVSEYLLIDQESQTGVAPPAIWPSRDGEISVEELTATYAPELGPVLKSVSFKVLPREKVGICGRTGSGKSTLSLCFFRFLEASSGRIVIDGLDISTLMLVDLRSRLTIVAQESTLFNGTIRSNLDPFSTFSDAEMWSALVRVRMASPNSTPGATPGPSRPVSRPASIHGSSSTTVADDAEDARFVVKDLDALVTEGGKNFSAGQRQLLSLARGILKLSASSILILDESTASLDQVTDEAIQSTIRSEMQDSTILCIAHRLRTIIDYDKILLLGEGRVLEYAPPWELLEDPQSAFSELCRRSGEFEVLKTLAIEAREAKLMAKVL